MRLKVVVGVAAALLIAATAFAQEGAAGAGRFEIGAFPGGGMFFTASSTGAEPAFGNYALGASFTVNFNRWVGIEGEGGGTIGVRQNFTMGSIDFADHKTPSMYGYTGNMVVHPAGNDRAVVPYATAGVGGLTISPTDGADNLGILARETYLTGNVGGGLKWFSSQRWGLRADYRFFMVKNKDNAPLFFGNENRYGHRVQGGLVFTY
jgi:outer membrane protein with beta-barrel domain